MTRKPAVKLEPGTKEWLNKTVAKLNALIKNSITGNTFFKHFETDREYLGQGELDALLKTAVREDKNEILEALLKTGANPNITIDYIMLFPAKREDISARETYCLHWACLNQLTNTAQILLDHGANPELKDIEDKTALDYCTDPEFYARITNYVQSKNMLDKKQDNEMLWDYELSL